MIRLVMVLGVIGLHTHLLQAADRIGLPDLGEWKSHVVGTPTPPLPYTTRSVLASVELTQLTDVVRDPAGQPWWFAIQRNGLIKCFEDHEGATASVVMNLEQEKGRRPRRFWSLAFHPQFESNGYLFISYLQPEPKPNRVRVSRFTIPKNERSKRPFRCKPNTEELIIDWISRSDHHGGCLRFGPDGYLYISAGDGSPVGDSSLTGQDITDCNASILRIDVDRTSQGRMYAIPKDNPFQKILGARPEVYAYGVRNIWKMSFDPQSGELWAADVGQDLWEWVLRVERGGNYGWSVLEGFSPYRPTRKLGPTPLFLPLVVHDHSEARSLTGGLVYRGKKFPKLHGKYVYGDYGTGKIWSTHGAGPAVMKTKELADTPLAIVGFADRANGEFLLYEFKGGLHEIIPSPPPDPNAKPFPTRLSETGLFASVSQQIPAPGVIPYSVNVPMWMDGAIAHRFMAVPTGEKVGVDRSKSWWFPNGSVLAQTIEMPLGDGKARRLETRLMHLEEKHWRGYTYLWNDEQSDAVLLEGQAAKRGMNLTLKIPDAKAPNGVRLQEWHVPGRAECTLCHTMPANYLLGVTTHQLNRDHDYRSIGGTTGDQFQTMYHLGLLKSSPHNAYWKKDDAGQRQKVPAPRFPTLDDEASSVSSRARAWLHTNCAHCHRKWGGGNADFQLLVDLPVEEMGLLGIEARAGNFGVKDARLLVPGEPDKSVVYHRIKSEFAGLRMPRLGSLVVDEKGVDLIRRWIQDMKQLRSEGMK